MVKFVNACVERDKKNFEKTDFCDFTRYLAFGL
jgi:hypothetical protein